MQKLWIGAALTGVLSLITTAHAADAEAGKAKSEVCVSCHGLNGKSNNPMYPSLKGQGNVYFIKALKAYRDGQRDDPIMSPMAKNLSDADIENLAAYYAGLK